MLTTTLQQNSSETKTARRFGYASSSILERITGFLPARSNRKDVFNPAYIICNLRDLPQGGPLKERQGRGLLSAAKLRPVKSMTLKNIYAAGRMSPVRSDGCLAGVGGVNSISQDVSRRPNHPRKVYEPSAHEASDCASRRARSGSPGTRRRNITHGNHLAMCDLGGGKLG